MPTDREQTNVVGLDVALNVPLRRSYAYKFSSPLPLIGTRVIVPFGKRTMMGVVVAHLTSLPKKIKLKRVESVLDEKPIFKGELIEVINWAANYYHHPIGEVWHAAMPTVLRKGLAKTHGLYQIAYKLLQVPENWREKLKRAQSQTAVMEYLYKHGNHQNHAVLIKALPNARGALQSLIGKDWLVKEKQIIVGQQKDQPKKANKLLVDQRKALETLSLNLDKFQCSVLAGITGSGKTEVYFGLIDKVLAQGKQVLVLLPEIALTDQHFARFTERFGDRVIQGHSGMNDVERYRVWWQMNAGLKDIVLSTRSGVFMMFKKLGLIIVDEEHDMSYKQQDGLKYHARSIAIKRAQLGNIPIVLGSATPSLETMYNIELGRYLSVSLHTRASESQLPGIELIDLNQTPTKSGLSQIVIEALAQTLKTQQQAIVFINRRGYAPVLYCPACQWTAQCKRCDAQMTTHLHSHALQCHHCGAIRAKPEICESCGVTTLITLGEGTQKIEETLLKLFPKANIQRFDRDELASAKKLHKAMQSVHANEVDVLVGTQLLSKGHDFANVHLVVVLNADQGLHSIDFRGAELLAQQLIQVAGRAGRSKQKGRVLIQTYFPTQPVMLLVQQHQYAAFAKSELAQRSLAQFPPYRHVALWRVRGRVADQVITFMQEIAVMGRQIQPAQTACFDAVKSPMFKRNGQYHAQLLVSAKARKILHNWLAIWIERVERDKPKGGLKWSIDVDPVSLF